jgi:hypothetical protein
MRDFPVVHGLAGSLITSRAHRCKSRRRSRFAGVWLPQLFTTTDVRWRRVPSWVRRRPVGGELRICPKRSARACKIRPPVLGGGRFFSEVTLSSTDAAYSAKVGVRPSVATNRQ